MLAWPEGSPCPRWSAPIHFAAARWRGGRIAGCGARATSGDAGDRISQTGAPDAHAPFVAVLGRGLAARPGKEQPRHRWLPWRGLRVALQLRLGAVSAELPGPVCHARAWLC